MANSRVYSNCCCSCWFEPEIIKIGQSSHKMYSNNIVNFQESTTILNRQTKKVWKLVSFLKLFLKVLFYLYYFVLSKYLLSLFSFTNFFFYFLSILLSVLSAVYIFSVFPVLCELVYFPFLMLLDVRVVSLFGLLAWFIIHGIFVWIPLEDPSYVAD